MSIFRWTAPIFKLASRRWSEHDFQQVADWLRPHVPPDGVFADIGGGTGDLGVGVARQLGARVVIVDATPQMLRRVDAHPWVSVRLAPAETIPFPSAWFDAVLCCDAFHHFRDQGAAVSEMARVIKPGGGLVVLDMEGTAEQRGLVWLERLLGEPGGFLTGEAVEALMAAHGITGSAVRHGRGHSYVFAGVVGDCSGAATKSSE